MRSRGRTRSIGGCSARSRKARDGLAAGHPCGRRRSGIEVRGRDDETGSRVEKA